MSGSYAFAKRAIDVTVSILALLILSPVLLLIACAIKLDSPGPVFFRQPRLGIGARTFDVLKFRSMFLGAEKLGVYEARDDPRVTRVGRILRRTSANELPQLVNVAKGEMSLVGPRPVLPTHPWPIEKYTPEQRRRFEVLPGITGLAQVNGRKNVPWEKRLKFDAEYAARPSFSLDIRILVRTIAVVLSMRDSYNATIPSSEADREQ